jgi:hypothetical protein
MSNEENLSKFRDSVFVLEYAANIRKKFNNGVTKTPLNFEIYEPYSSAYGNFDFKSDGFSNSLET